MTNRLKEVKIKRRGLLMGAVFGASAVPLSFKQSLASPNSSPIRVLSIDGGGMRGIIPALVLRELEGLTGKRISELFDVVVGTSTGALLSAGITVSDPEGKPRYSADDLVSVYENYGSYIFTKGRGVRQFVHNLSRPMYDPSHFEGILERYFSDALLSECLVELAIPSISFEDHGMDVFSRREARVNSSRNYLIKDVVRAATAAPTFFPAARITSLNNERTGHFIDAGISSNNPSLLGFSEAKLLDKDAPVICVSLGTGKAPASIDPEKATNWGELEWALALLDMQGEGQSTFTTDVLSRLLVHNHDILFRFQVNLEEIPPQMDIATAEHTNALKKRTLAEIEKRKQEIENIATQLL
jgi:uncharacterized protein